MMIRTLLALALLCGVVAGRVEAQPVRSPACGALGCYLIPGTSTITGIKIGPFAGYSLTTTSYGSVMIGPGAGALAVSPNGEMLAIGPRACGTVGNYFGDTCLGESAGSSDPVAQYMTVVGNDEGRDATGLSFHTLVGTQNLWDGNPTYDNTVIGALSLRGSAGTLEVPTGTYHAGDVYKVTFSTTSGSTTIPSPGYATFTVSTTTAAAVATGLSNAMAALGITYSYPQPTGMNFPATTMGTNLGLDSLGNYFIALHIQGSSTTGAQISMAVTCTGTCSQTITNVGEFTGGYNFVAGVKALYNPMLTAAIHNNVIGDFAATSAELNYSDNDVMGFQAHYQATNNQREVAMGSFTCYGQGTTDNICIGYKSGFGLGVGGNNNVIIKSGNLNGAGSITTGAGNLEIDGEVYSPTTNFQMSIANALYGYGNGKHFGGGYGELGAYCNTNNANATWTICDAGGNTTYGTHFGVVQTTAPTISNATFDSHPSDVTGTLTLSAANPVVTFKTAFNTTPHCIVSSPSGTAFTYSVSTTALTFTGGASSNTVSYVCVQ